jgi:Ca-activated chloride channel family protein
MTAAGTVDFRSAGFRALDARSGKEISLAMQSLWLTGRVTPAGARLLARHVFRTDGKKPVEVVYSFALPRDAALRSFRIEGEGFTAHSSLEPAAEAVKRYEEGISEGALSTLARVYADGVVNLNVGNVRPGEEVSVTLEIVAGVEARDGGFRFRFPFTLAPRYHRLARMIEAAPGEGEMELPEDLFGDVILPRYRADASNLHGVGFDLEIALPDAGAEVGSPSHHLRVRHGGRSARVRLAADKDVPDRDLVLDVRLDHARPAVYGGPRADGKVHFAAIVPSSCFGAGGSGPRRAVIVLDRSGSMAGPPIEQARKAIEACLGALAEQDEFGLVAFDDRVESFTPTLNSGSAENRNKARKFLSRIEARGGTDLAAGILEAARILGPAGGDVLVMTDGQVAGTGDILARARQTGIRLHCLGIGAASQDHFLTQLARETGGVSRFLGPRERVDLAAVDLFAGLGRPVASGIAVSGAAVQPDPPSCIFAGTPLVLYGQADSPRGELRIAWDGGSLEVPFELDSAALGHLAWLLQGARLITGLESRFVEEAPSPQAEKRHERRLAGRLASLSREYGLASREMSLVAVVRREGDRPDLPETKIVPVGMPQDTAFHAYFGAVAAPLPMACPAPGAPSIHSFGAVLSFVLPLEEQELSEEVCAPGVDQLLDLAAAIEPDGGMPGAAPEDRILATMIALMAFLSEGHTESSGAFRSHVARLAAWLARNLSALSDRRLELARAVLKAVRASSPAGSGWLDLARRPHPSWEDFEALWNQPA